MKKKALCTGITGQTGSYLAELLLEKGYEVHGIIRRSSSFNTGRIDHIFDKLHLHYGDVTDPLSTNEIVRNLMPDEIYNLAAQSHVKTSFEIPYYTAQADALGPLNILEAARVNCPKARIYQASTSELYGLTQEKPQRETTPFYPRSPYGVAKLYGYWITKNYRESYGMYACSGILFNHESPRRGETFVTQKTIKALHRISKKKQEVLSLGNLNAKRDWGHAKDYAEAMWLMLQQKESVPKDYVIATGEQHTIRDLVEEAAPYFGMAIRWFKEGAEEIGFDVNNGKVVVVIDPKYYRPAEVDDLLGDATKAREELGWTPKTNFKNLIKEMCEHEKRL